MGPIYKVWQARFTEAWYQLSEEEQQRMFALARQALDNAGGKTVVICDAAWSNERWPVFGVEEFPDVEAVQRHRQLMTELNSERYMDSRTTLGTQLVLPD